MRRYAQMVRADSNWLDEIPGHWRLGRLDHVAAAWPSNVDKHTVEGQDPVRLCNYTDVYKNGSITVDLAFMRASASSEQIQRFRIRRGDVLLTKDSETADDIGIPAFVEYEAADLVCGYHLSIVRPLPDQVVPKFLYWALAAGPTVGQWAVMATGVTRVGIKAGDLSKVALALPPLEEQEAITDYLDRETARIDTLIEEQQRLTDLLRERRDAAVESAISSVQTRGPRLKHLIVSVRQGWSPQCYAWSADGVATWAVLKAGSANRGVFRPMENKELPDDETPRPDIVVRKGDLIVSRANTRDLVGSAAVVEGDFPRLMLSDKLYALVLDDRMAVPRFVAAVLGSRRWRDLIELEATGASYSMLNISQSDIVNLPMPVPPLDEQRRIAAYLEEQTAKIDTLVAETERFIELARERRSALITAAVTGRLDVREAA